MRELDRLGDQHRGTVQGPIHKQVLTLPAAELVKEPSVPVEIERKFLVVDDGWCGHAASQRFCQGYLA